MPKEVIYIPFDAELARDIIRFSDGKLDPAILAVDQVWGFITSNPDNPDFWGDRVDEVIQKYAPQMWEQWQENEAEEGAKLREQRQPLIWKGVTIAAGSEVRMSYDGKNHFAKVQRGAIVDDGKEYSPSEWASKVADGTSRNAWRDLWIKEPLSRTWVPASLLREQANQELKNINLDLSDI